MFTQPAAQAAVPVHGRGLDASPGPRRPAASRPTVASADETTSARSVGASSSIDIPSVMRDAVLAVDGADDPRSALARAFASALQARGLDVAEVATAMRNAGPFALNGPESQAEGPAAELLAALDPGSVVSVTA